MNGLAMQDINLLPWREQKREHEKKVFLVLIGLGLSFAILIVCLANCYVSYLTNVQLSRNDILQKELHHKQVLIRQIKTIHQQKELLISRLSKVQNLQSAKILLVHLFYELVNILPNGVYFSKLVKHDELVSLWGYAKSQSHIANLMIDIEHNAWIKEPILTEIKKMEIEGRAEKNAFQLNFILKSS